MASKKSYLDSLRKVSLFSSCSTKDLEKISKAGDEVTLPAGSLVIDQGQTGREAFIIISGTATVRRNGKKSPFSPAEQLSANSRCWITVRVLRL